MGTRVNQTTIPSFRTHKSYIGYMANNVILFCEDYIGERRNFIVVDSLSITADGNDTSVETAYINGWIIDFPNVPDKRRAYKWSFPHTDIKFNKYHLHQDVLRDKLKFEITVDGVAFTDFTFVVNGSNYTRKYQNGLGTYYTTHLYFDNGYPAGE